jgi:hypothetical protein
VGDSNSGAAAAGARQSRGADRTLLSCLLPVPSLRSRKSVGTVIGDRESWVDEIVVLPVSWRWLRGHAR